MPISKYLKTQLENIYQSFLKDERILKMKEIPMHRGSSCYYHSFRVAKIAVHRAIKLGGYRLKSLLIASILHDYYLYDWRTNKELAKHHGVDHPQIAIENAKRDFNISKSVEDIMLSHMWPLTIKNAPKTKEAWLLNHVDNVVATREFLVSKNHKVKKRENYDKFIEKLFDD